MTPALLILLAAAVAAPSFRPEESVVRLQVQSARYDWSSPWRVQSAENGSGSGFLLSGGRIVTNAHVVRDARQILVKRRHVADPFLATVVAEGIDCDLALLQVADPAFAKGLPELELGDLPAVRTNVTIVGFPLGGDEASSTSGIVSRISFARYAHSGWDSHLVVQTDAAINPGNSGGPVVQDGRVVGVAFQNMPGMSSIGYFIPAPVVRHFLGDLADGRYDGFPDGGVREDELLSPAYRAERGLAAGRSGVVVTAVAPGSTADGALRPGDVLLSAQGKTVEDDGNIRMGDTEVPWVQVLEEKQVGEPVAFRVLRDGKEQELKATARRVVRWDRFRWRYGFAPRFVLYGGLLFQPLEAEYLRTWGDWTGHAPRLLVWHHLFREWEKPAEAGREVIVLSRVLRHPVNSQASLGTGAVLQRVDGKEIRGLDDLARALDEASGKTVVFEFEHDGLREALDREAVAAARPEILRTYGVSRDRNLQDRPPATRPAPATAGGRP